MKGCTDCGTSVDHGRRDGRPLRVVRDMGGDLTVVAWAVRQPGKLTAGVVLGAYDAREDDGSDVRYSVHACVARAAA
jgi:hypothetical protein